MWQQKATLVQPVFDWPGYTNRSPRDSSGSAGHLHSVWCSYVLKSFMAFYVCGLDLFSKQTCLLETSMHLQWPSGFFVPKSLWRMKITRGIAGLLSHLRAATVISCSPIFRGWGDCSHEATAIDGSGKWEHTLEWAYSLNCPLLPRSF